MTIGRRVVQQTSLQVLGKITSTLLGVAAIALITRGLGLEGFGSYATVMAYLQMFGIAVDLGLNVLAPTVLGESQASSRRPVADSTSSAPGYRLPAIGSRLSAPVVLSNIFTMRLAASVAVFTIAAAAAWVIPAYSVAVRIGIAIAVVSFLTIVLTQILQAPFQVATDMRGSIIADVAGRVALVAALGVVAWYGWGLHAMIVATALGNLVTFAAAFVAASRMIPIHLAWDVEVWAGILRRSWPIALSILFNLVYLRADQVLLSLMRTETEVGIYAAPYRLLDVLTQFPHMVMGLVLPLLAAAWATQQRAQFHERLQRTFDGLALIGFPLAAGAMVLATPLMTFLAGAEFAVSGPVLTVLALALVGLFLGAPFGYAVVAVGAQRRMLWGYAMVAVLTLVGYLLTIPTWSYWGAAWMTVVSETAIALLTFAVVARVSTFTLSLRIACVALLASALMAAAVWAAPLPVIPRIGLGAIVYGIVMLAVPSTRHIVFIALR